MSLPSPGHMCSLFSSPSPTETHLSRKRATRIVLHFSDEISPESCIPIITLPSLSGYVIGYYSSLHTWNILRLTVTLQWQCGILLRASFCHSLAFPAVESQQCCVTDADTFLHIKAKALGKPASEFHSSKLMPSLSTQPDFVSPSASSLSTF